MPSCIKRKKLFCRRRYELAMDLFFTFCSSRSDTSLSRRSMISSYQALSRASGVASPLHSPKNEKEPAYLRCSEPALALVAILAPSTMRL